jgi:hypothetical protein
MVNDLSSPLRGFRAAVTSSSPSRSRSRDCGYALGDKLKEIITIRKDNQIKTIEFYVAWQPRRDGFAPKPSWVSDTELRVERFAVVVLLFKSIVTLI